ncbi:MAG TPA: transcription termination/antitermination NusG family protein [Pyrinomonadaceae bacterium]|nr:transcription termination/antitermination NusG family protein [Pyrinomonadaceae bacterium]
MINAFDDVLRWYVVKTQPKQEVRAECNLRVWGLNTFLPKVRERHTNPYTGVSSNVIRPLFPRYLFTQFEVAQSLRRVCFTRGVHSVLNFGNGPTSIDDEIIQMIQLRVGEDGLVQLDGELSEGDPVMINSGPLQHLVGVFQHDIKGTDRVAILLSAISFQGRVIIERDLVKKIV